MSDRKNTTIFDQFLAPVVNLLIDKEEIRRNYEGTNWQEAIQRYQQPNLIYPEYYRQENFHGIKGGYLTPGAAVTYDPITQYALPPNENLVRQGLIDKIRVKPQRILDLGCGTGSTTIMLKQTFPQAEVIGLDLSPYMLVVANTKSTLSSLNIQWLHGNAETTDFESNSFDLITASLLFHETPPNISQAIFRESFRLLKTGGEMLILDGNQKTLRQLDWLQNIFEEPYIKDYSLESVDAGMGAAGFRAVQTEDLWFLHQVTRGVKPIENQGKVQDRELNENDFKSEDWQPAPGF